MNQQPNPTFILSLQVSARVLHNVRNYRNPASGDKFTAIHLFGDKPGDDLMITTGDTEIRHRINQIMAQTRQPLAPLTAELQQQLADVLAGNYLVEQIDRGAHLRQTTEAPRAKLVIDENGMNIIEL